MGITTHQFYFKQGLPKVEAIKDTFFRITGLSLRVYSIAHIDELMTNDKDLLYQLRKNEEETNTVVINAPYFSCSDFNRVYLGDYMSAGDKTFYLEYGAGKSNHYFYYALIKAMLETGGVTYKNNYITDDTDEYIEQFLKPYQPHEPFWMRLKKWDEMSEFEKERFNHHFDRW